MTPIIAHEIKQHFKVAYEGESEEKLLFYTYVMPRLDYSLDDMLERHLCLEFETVRKLAIQGLLALKSIHATGFVHSDIKPQNLMFTIESCDKKKSADRIRLQIIDFDRITRVGDSL